MPITVRHDIPGLAAAASAYAGGFGEFGRWAAGHSLKRQSLAEQVKSQKAQRDLQREMQERAGELRKEEAVAGRSFAAEQAEFSHQRSMEARDAEYQDRLQYERDSLTQQQDMELQDYERRMKAIDEDQTFTPQEKVQARKLITLEHSGVARYRGKQKQPKQIEVTRGQDGYDTYTGADGTPGQITEESKARKANEAKLAKIAEDAKTATEQRERDAEEAEQKRRRERAAEQEKQETDRQEALNKRRHEVVMKLMESSTKPGGDTTMTPEKAVEQARRLVPAPEVQPQYATEDELRGALSAIQDQQTTAARPEQTEAMEEWTALADEVERLQADPLTPPEELEAAREKLRAIMETMGL